MSADRVVIIGRRAKRRRRTLPRQRLQPSRPRRHLMRALRPGRRTPAVIAMIGARSGMDLTGRAVAMVDVQSVANEPILVIGRTAKNADAIGATTNVHRGLGKQAGNVAAKSPIRIPPSPSLPP